MWGWVGAGEISPPPSPHALAQLAGCSPDVGD